MIRQAAIGILLLVAGCASSPTARPAPEPVAPTEYYEAGKKPVPKETPAQKRKQDYRELHDAIDRAQKSLDKLPLEDAPQR